VKQHDGSNSAFPAKEKSQGGDETFRGLAEEGRVGHCDEGSRHANRPKISECKILKDNQAEKAHDELLIHFGKLREDFED
jgi:hypothetical protein